MKKILMVVLFFTLGFMVACQAETKNDLRSAPTEEPTYTTTQTAIKIDADSTLEYSIDNGQTWMSNDVVFNQLEAGTTYVILFRFKATETLPASEYSEVQITTQNYLEEDISLNKVLVIGNQNAKDIVESIYAFMLENDLQIDLILGVIGAPNASLEILSNDTKTKSATYTYSKYTPEQSIVKENNFDIVSAIRDEPWDLIIFEQTSALGGILKSYTPYLDELISLIHEHKTNQFVEIGFQMPWAFHPESTHEGFSNYRNDQERMYKNIASRMQDSVVNKAQMHQLIPTGTAIQNLRTSVIRNDVTLADGQRLNKIGNMTAMLMWLKQLIDFDLNLIEPVMLNLDSDTLGAMKEAVENAMKTPYEVTKSTEYSNPYKDKLYMLSIGNSFTQDAYNYMAQMLIDIGIKDFVIGYLYSGGASLSLHKTRIENNGVYDQYRIWHNSTTPTTRNNGTIKFALEEYDWDIITVQQVSSDSGVALSFMNTLTPLMKQIKALNPNDAHTTYGYHMTWAYTDHWEFGRYNHDQLYMYERIVEATKEAVLTNEYIDFVIPAGTAIQKLRQSSIGDNVTRDGYHLNGLGQFTAGLTWVKYITNIDLNLITTLPVGVNVSPNIGLIHQAVEHAYNKPYTLDS